MKLLFLCPRWGSESMSAQEFILKALECGYEGIEIALTDGDKVALEAAELARTRGIPFVTQHWMTFDRAMKDHLKAFERRLREAAAFSPLFVNSHTGRDLFTLDENRLVFEIAEKITAETGVPVYHETHRGRCFHSSWRTAEFLKVNPSTRLVFDMSHWCNVSESLLEDQEDIINSLLPAVSHIHSRVGWAQGPQVSDPRAPEWDEALNAHLKWWDRIIECRKASGCDLFTVTPEFGPSPYMPLAPYTREPLANQWDINVHMMNLLRHRYQ